MNYSKKAYQRLNETHLLAKDCLRKIADKILASISDRITNAVEFRNSYLQKDFCDSFYDVTCYEDIGSAIFYIVTKKYDKRGWLEDYAEEFSHDAITEKASLILTAITARLFITFRVDQAFASALPNGNNYLTRLFPFEVIKVDNALFYVRLRKDLGDYRVVVLGYIQQYMWRWIDEHFGNKTLAEAIEDYTNENA